ncbi:small ribosomal subunit protein mS23 [Cylas formicarius]|uniref:small ribosomal subunit protein mS23 n=1 Tax=Cylas formicarius TaxID=197179 RepID=UPI0029586AA0|nr:small ribosomal subunit protein mS23 [Cylas formicarius]
MAGSRLEKIGTIYTRVSGLIQSGALNWQDRPLWFDIYKAFPPKEEPQFDRPVPNMKLKKIFYEEDRIRAIFHRNNKQIGTINLNSDQESLTQKFINVYSQLENKYSADASEEHIYKEAIDILNRDREVSQENDSVSEEEPISLSSAFKEAQNKHLVQSEIKVSVKDIFKD